MNAEIITIGDEILIGQIVDTNSAWMGQKLNEIGVNVIQITSISDNEQHIIEALNNAQKHADLILTTGGLGPTKDDITKITLCKYFNSHLVFNEQAFADVENLLKKRGRESTNHHRVQVELPNNCEPVFNKVGTAPGMWFERNNKIFVSMPGVPYEMKAMMENDVLLRLKQKSQATFIAHKTILTIGVGETIIADLISEWENKLPQYMKLAYLPAIGTVRLRLTGKSKTGEIKHEVESEMKKIEPLIQKYIYGYDDDSMEEIVGKLLREKRQTIATAESCTGGYLAHMITSVPGSSDYYLGSVIAYENKVKENFLSVGKDEMIKNGVVSEAVVSIMADHARKKFDSDYVVATSGIAGPGGGTLEKPVGTVCIAVATPKRVFSRTFRFGDHRLRNIHVTSLTALDMLRRELLNSD